MKTIGEVIRGMENGDVLWANWGVRYYGDPDDVVCVEYRIYEKLADAMDDTNDDRYIDGGIAVQTGLGTHAMRALRDAYYVRRIGDEYELLNGCGGVTGRITTLA